MLLAPLILPPEPLLVIKLATIKLPVAFNVPEIFAPVPVTTNTLALPTALILTLPLATGMFILLLPLLTPAELRGVQLNPPPPFVCNTYPLEPPIMITLLTEFKLDIPVTLNVPKTLAPVLVTTNEVLPEDVILTLPLLLGILTLLLPLARGPNILPAVKLPVMFAVPVMFAPVPVITNVVLPTAVRLMFPLADGIFTLLLPLACGPIKLPPVILPVAIIKPPVPILPILAFPLMLAVPLMLAPVPVMTTMFALPTELNVILPLLLGI